MRDGVPSAMPPRATEPWKRPNFVSRRARPLGEKCAGFEGLALSRLCCLEPKRGGVTLADPAMRDALILQNVSEAQWIDFQGGAAGPFAYPEVIERWTRARDLGATAEGLRPDDLVLGEERLRERRDRAGSLLFSAEQTLACTSRLLSDKGFVLLVSDADGVLLETRGGGDFAPVASQGRLVAGSMWHEGMRGTNAIGTCISEERPVHVYGRAHYGRSYHDLVCFSAPVLDVDGSVAAVLDATSVLECAEANVSTQILIAAQALGEIMRHRAYAAAGPKTLRLLSRTLERFQRPALLVEPTGLIARHNEAARRSFGEMGASTDVLSVLGIGFHELLAEAASPCGGVPLSVSTGPASAPTAMRAIVEPLDAADGRLIALLVFLEEERRSVF